MKLPLSTYVAYRKSESEWTNCLPSDWSEKRVKDLFMLIAQMAPPNHAYQLLSLFASIGVRPREEMEQRGNKSVTTEGYWMVKKGDIVVNKLLAWMGAIGLSTYEGVTSPAYDILRKKSREVDERYFEYLFRTERSQQIFKRHSRGIMEVRLRLYFDKFGALSVPVPPFPEQQAITDYLDVKTAQIDRKIDLLTQKAEKYRQLKRSLINEAVTRGLDKSVPMKDSGVAWIGDVPAHWQMKRHKDCLSLVTSRCTDSSLMKVALENIEGQTGRYMPTDSAYDGDGVRFRVGDILFGKLRPYLAKVFLADFEGTAVGDIFVYRPKSSILPRFARQLMLSKRYLDVINSSTAGAKMPRVSADFISDLPVFTPSLLEQEAIIQYLDDKTGQIDQIIGAMDNQITKLKELRKALINDVVTGKLRVT